MAGERLVKRTLRVQGFEAKLEGFGVTAWCKASRLTVGPSKYAEN